MSFWLLLVTAVLLCALLLETIVSLLNLRALQPNLPEEFIDIFDASEYEKSQAYTKARARFSLISGGCSSLLTIIFLLTGGFNWIDLKIRSLDQGELSSGLIFISALAILSFIVNLPFSIYSTFVIEENFGFNKTSVKTYILDLTKGVALAICLGLPLLAGILWFFTNFGSSSWLYCWFLLVAFMIVVQLLAPSLIMPLFNKFSPLPEGELKNTIEQYAIKQRFQIQGIYTMDGSKRSTKLNAFFTGFGRFRKIVFFDTLMEKLQSDQILAVLAHEMGHYRLRHIHKMLLFSVLQTGLMMFLLGQFLQYDEISLSLGMSYASTYSGLLFFSLLFTPISLVFSIIFNLFSRKHEFEADKYAALTTHNVNSLISGLQELSKANLSNLTPHPVYVFIHYSHPPVLSRIRNLRSMKSA